jgi:Tfp pilus assembly protein PilV
MRALARQDGGLLIEVMVSAVVLLLVATAVFKTLDAASARSGATKSRAIAGDLAQADLERLRAMKLSDLSNLRETNTSSVDGIPYTVASRADWVTDKTGTASCSSADSQADYIRISSTVTWRAMAGLKPVVLTSVIAAPIGSFGTDEGSLAVQVTDAAGNPVAGKQVTLTGPESYSDATNELGCVLWGFLTQGNYTVTLAPGCSDRSGNEPVTKPAGVVGEALTTLNLDCDVPGDIRVRFDTRALRLPGNAYAVEASKGRYVMAANSGLPAPFYRTFGDGTAQTEILANDLYPFTDPYGLYAGTCTGADPRTSPNTGTATLQSAPRGGSVGPVTVRQPALNLDVESGNTGTQLAGASVKATVDGVKTPGCSGSFDMGLTNANGQLVDPGVPYGTYDICAQKKTGSVTYAVTVQDVADTRPDGTALTQINVPTSGTANVGTCP